MSSSHCETASDNDNKDVGASRSMDCQARTGGNNDGAGNPRNIPCNHAGLAWSTFPRPSPSPRSISLSLAQELDVLSQDGYGSNTYIPASVRPVQLRMAALAWFAMSSGSGFKVLMWSLQVTPDSILVSLRARRSQTSGERDLEEQRSRDSSELLRPERRASGLAWRLLLCRSQMSLCRCSSC